MPEAELSIGEQQDGECAGNQEEIVEPRMKERSLDERFDENVVEGVTGAGDDEKRIFQVSKGSCHESEKSEDDQTKKCGDAQLD